MENIEFNEHWIEGCANFKKMTDEGKYIYEMFWRNNAEDSGEYFFGIILSDEPLTNEFTPNVTCTFNKEILDCLVKRNDEKILNKAKELDAEVFGYEYKHSSSYRGSEPWASIQDAINIAKKDINSEKEDIIEIMTNEVIANSKKRGK